MYMTDVSHIVPDRQTLQVLKLVLNTSHEQVL